MSRSSNFIVRGGADFSAIQRETARTQTTLNNFQRNLSSTMKKIKVVLGTVITGNLIKESTKMAMATESSLDNISRNMGESSRKFQNWVETQSKSLGMAKADAYQYGSVFSNLLGSFSKSAEETSNKTQDLMKAAAIIASKTGREYDDVANRIRSGMLGSTEAIEDLGIYTNISMIESTEAFKKFAGNKSWEKLDFQVQQQIRLAAILEQTYSRYGDTLADTTATRQAKFIASLSNIKLGLGQAFLPIYNTILPALTSMANSIERVVNSIAQFSQALFGTATSTKATNQQANSISELGDATEEAGKQAKKSVAGFDEINSLGLDSGNGGTGASNGIATEDLLPDVDEGGIIGETSTKIEEMASKVKTTFNSIRENIIANKEIIISALGGIAAGFLAFKTLSFLSVIPQVITAIGVALSALTTPIIVASAIIGGLVASFLYLYQTNEQFRNKMHEVWAETAQILINFRDNTLKPIFDYIVNGFLVPIGEAFKENILPVLADIFIGAGQILNDILNLIISTIDNIWGIVKQGLDLVKTIIIDALEIIKSLWDKYGQDLINNVRSLIQGLQETFQLIWDNIINPIIQPALEMLTWLWTEHIKGLIEQVGEFVMKCINGALELYNGFIKPIIDWMIVEFGPAISNVVTFVVNVFGNMLAGISDIIKGLFKVLGGIVDFIVGVFTGNWKKAWEGIKNIVDTIFNSIFDTIESIVNKIIDTVTGMFDTITGIVTKVTDALGNVVDKVGSVFSGGKGSGGVAHLPDDHPDKPGSEEYKKNNPNMPSWLGGGGGSLKIPKLARGGIVDGPTVAMIGEAGKEMVVPLENTSFVDTLASALGSAVMAAMQLNSNQNTSSVQSGESAIYLDGAKVGRAILHSLNQEAGRLGFKPILRTE